jgi:hypothetical protein
MKNPIFSIIAAIAVAFFFLNSITALSTSTQAALSNENEWRLEVLGLVDHPLNLTSSEIAAMPPTTVQATIYCVDFPNQVVTAGDWTGVKLGFLLEKAGVSPSATKVAFFASDGYSTDLILEAATQPDVIVAYEKDGAPLGETLRLVVPGKWGYKWISQLTRIEIVNFDFKGKWESLGYSDYGNETSVDLPNIPVVPTIPNLTTDQQNGTTISPTSPNSSNSSSALPSQEPQNSVPETPEPQNPEPFPIAPIAVVSVASVAMVGSVLLVYLRKRKH